MDSSEILQKVWRRSVLVKSPLSLWRTFVFRARGAHISRGTLIPPRTAATWPHQIQLGEKCLLQSDIFFNYDHYWTPGPSIVIGNHVFIGRGVEFNIRGRIEIGDDALIASGCVFVDHDHGRDSARPMNSQSQEVRPIAIGRNVWIGTRCVILKGVEIGDGTVVAAGAVVTRSVPAGETWAGIPARKIRSTHQSYEFVRHNNL